MSAFVDWAKFTLHFGNAGLFVPLLVVGVVLLFVRPRWGRPWVAALVLALWFVSAPVGSWLLMMPLVRGLQPIQHASEAGQAGAIVVLGGGIEDVQTGDEALAVPQDWTTLRLMEGVRVFRLLEERPIIVASGGATAPGRRISEAAVMAEALARLGVPPERIVLDERSRNTHDQAINVTRLLRERGIMRFVLVTSPAHVVRSLLVFRSQHADTIASPSALVPDYTVEWGWLTPNNDSLRLSDAAVYEYGGLIYYWWNGWLTPVPGDGRQ